MQFAHFVDVHAELGHHRPGNRLGGLPQVTAGVGEGDFDDPFVAVTARLRHIAQRFEAFDQRRHGRRFETQQSSDLAHRQLRMLPQRKHDQVLRMGQTDRFEHGPVGADHPT